MGLWQQFPYPDYHNLNLDWVLTEVKEVRVKVDGLVSEVQDMIDGAEKKFEAQFQAFRNEINQTITALNLRLDAFEKMIQKQFEDYQVKLDTQIAKAMEDIQALLDKFQGEINGQLQLMREMIRNSEASTRAYVDSEIQKVIDMIPEITSVYVRNPITGKVQPIQEALDSMNNYYRYFGLNCLEYEARNWTAKEYEDLNMTAVFYDFYSKERFAWISPFTGEWFSTYDWLNMLTGFHKENGLTATEYDAILITAQAYDALMISAYNYDFQGKNLVRTR